MAIKPLVYFNSIFYISKLNQFKRARNFNSEYNAEMSRENVGLQETNDSS